MMMFLPLMASGMNKKRMAKKTKNVRVSPKEIQSQRIFSALFFVLSSSSSSLAANHSTLQCKAHSRQRTKKIHNKKDSIS
jgi:hypothetical protein